MILDAVLALGTSVLVVGALVVAAREVRGMHRRGVARLAEHRRAVDAAVRRHPAGRAR